MQNGYNIVCDSERWKSPKFPAIQENSESIQTIK